jgi:adenylate cyclase class 2
MLSSKVQGGGTSMLEIEVKYRVTDFQSIEQHLCRVKAQFLREQEEVDLYFNAPHRDFSQTDEAVRLRTVGETNCLTYKGPRIDKDTKTRTEIEVFLAPAASTHEAARQWLEAVGFRPVRRVAKTRKLYQLEHQGHRIAISLDQVQDLGSFVELEIVASDELLDEAKALLFRLANDWHLHEMERRSYLEILCASAVR